MKKFFVVLVAVLAFAVAACVPGNGTATPFGPGTSHPYGWYLITHESSSALCNMTVSAPDGRRGTIGIDQPNNTAILIESPINSATLNNNCAAQFRDTAPAVSVVIRATSYLH